MCVAIDQQIKEMNTLVDSSVKGLPKNPIQRNQSCFSEAGVRRIPQCLLVRTSGSRVHTPVESMAQSTQKAIHKLVLRVETLFEGIESRKRNCFSLMAGTHLDTQYSLLPHSDKWIGMTFESSVFFGTNVS